MAGIKIESDSRNVTLLSGKEVSLTRFSFGNHDAQVTAQEAPGDLSGEYLVSIGDGQGRSLRVDQYLDVQQGSDDDKAQLSADELKQLVLRVALFGSKSS